MLKHKELTDSILRCFYVVYNSLGDGFLEKVYENALAIELRAQGLAALQQVPVNVYYRKATVGEYIADLLVADKVIVEVKSVEALTQAHVAQLLNYLKATNIEVGLVLNFGPRPEFRRRVFGPSHAPEEAASPQ